MTGEHVGDDNRKVWVLADDRAGNRSQAEGVAVALGEGYAVKDLSYGPLATVPNALLPPTFAGLKPAARADLSAPWPNLVIAAGRRTAPVARRIKRLSGGRSRLVQVMHPGGRIDDIDLVCVPSHDPAVRGANVLSIVGAPHGLTTAALTDAKAASADRANRLPEPRIALVVGGTTRRRTFTEAMASELGALATQMVKQAGGSLMVTTSRRTGAGATDALIAAIDVPGDVYRWGDDGDNPYHGFLAWADAVVVTGDSMSMCSEACASTVSVYIYAPSALITAKHARFHQALYDDGLARPLDGTFDTWTHAPLNAAETIAQAIRERGL